MSLQLKSKSRVARQSSKQLIKNAERHGNWVTRFMLYDVFIIGAGISPSEIVNRLILVQRQRNLARIEPKNRPKTVFLDVKEKYLDGLVDYNLSSSWDQAWGKALSIKE